MPTCLKYLGREKWSLSLITSEAYQPESILQNATILTKRQVVQGVARLPMSNTARKGLLVCSNTKDTTPEYARS